MNIIQSIQTRIAAIEGDLALEKAKLETAVASAKPWLEAEIEVLKADILSNWHHLFPESLPPKPAQPVALGSVVNVGGGGGPVEPT